MNRFNKTLLTTASCIALNLCASNIYAVPPFNATAEFNQFLTDFYKLNDFNQSKSFVINYNTRYNNLSNQEQREIDIKANGLSNDELSRLAGHGAKIVGINIDDNTLKSLDLKSLFGSGELHLNETQIKALKTKIAALNPTISSQQLEERYKNFKTVIRQFGGGISSPKASLAAAGFKTEKTPEAIAKNKELTENLKRYVSDKNANKSNAELDSTLKLFGKSVDTKMSSKNLNAIFDILSANGIDLSSLVEVANNDELVNNNKSYHNAALAVGTMQKMTAQEREAVVKTGVKQMTQKVFVAPQIANLVHSGIGARIENITMANADNGVAAGDNAVSFGPWVKGLYGISHQKALNELNAGYNARNYGGSVGVDVNIDNNVIGIAYSHIRSNFKFRNDRAGDKLDVTSHVGSIYGQVVINDAFMWSPILSYNQSNYKTSDLINLGKANNRNYVAKGKYKGKGGSIDNTFGYKMNVNENVAVVPNLGLRYDIQYEKDYTRNSAGVYNSDTSKYLHRSFSGSLGAKALMSYNVTDETIVQPSLHFAVEKYFTQKAKNLQVGLTWTNAFDQTVSDKLNKRAKIGYNLGGSVLAKNGIFETVAFYTCNLKKKYQSHQFGLKFKASV